MENEKAYFQPGAIPVNRLPDDALSPALRDLADLLVDIAISQIANEQAATAAGENR